MARDGRKISFDSNRLRWARRYRRKTNEDLAVCIQRSEDAIRGAIRDKNILPEHLEEIANELEVSFDYLRGTQSIPADEQAIDYYVSVYGSDPLIDPDGMIVLPYNKRTNLFDSEKAFGRRKELLTEYLIALGERGIEGFYQDTTEEDSKWLPDGHMYQFSIYNAEQLVSSDPLFELELIRFISQYLSEHTEYFGQKLPASEFKIIE